MSAPLRGLPPKRSAHSGGGAEAREAAAAARAAASSAGVAAAEWVGGLVAGAVREGEEPRWAAVAAGRAGRRLRRKRERERGGRGGVSVAGAVGFFCLSLPASLRPISSLLLYSPWPRRLGGGPAGLQGAGGGGGVLWVGRERESVGREVGAWRDGGRRRRGEGSAGAPRGCQRGEPGSLHSSMALRCPLSGAPGCTCACARTPPLHNSPAGGRPGPAPSSGRRARRPRRSPPFLLACFACGAGAC